MKQIQTGIIAVCLAAALLSGCANSAAQSIESSTTASSATQSTESSISASSTDVSSVSTAGTADYDGGSGTQEDPYQINSVDSLLPTSMTVRMAVMPVFISN